MHKIIRYNNLLGKTDPSKRKQKLDKFRNSVTTTQIINVENTVFPTLILKDFCDFPMELFNRDKEHILNCFLFNFMVPFVLQKHHIINCDCQLNFEKFPYENQNC